MDAFLLYSLKMIICSAVMYAYYLMFLKDKTFHHYNRFYLLLTVLISVSLPLLKLSYFTMEINPKVMFLFQNLQATENTTNHGISFYQIFYAIIGLVSVILLAKLVIGLIRINHIKKAFPHEELQGIKFYQTNLDEAPFSFFRNLFWKKSIQMESAVGQQILKHEMVHIEQKHTWDKLFMQITKSIFWMNPIFYIINKEINLIHEYLADNKAVKRSDTKAFAQMLLESHFPGTTLPATSPFLSSNLKKRLKMLTKSKTKYSYARRIFALPLLFMLSFAYLVNAKNQEIKKTNIAIDEAVKSMKKDTVIVNPQQEALENSQKGLRETNDQIQKDNEKIAEINKKIADKNKAINDLVKAKKENSPEYLAKTKEVEGLANDVDNIINSDRYQTLLKRSDDYVQRIDAYYNSPEYKKKIADIERNAAEIEKKYNSPEYKKKIADIERNAAEIEKKYNSPEYKKKIADIEQRAAELEKRYNSPEWKKQIEEAAKSGSNVYIYNGKDYISASTGKTLSDPIVLYGKDYISASTGKTLSDPIVLSDFAMPAIEFDKLLKDIPTFDFKDFGLNEFGFGREMTAKEKRQYEKRKKEIAELQKKLNEKRKDLRKDMPMVDRPWVVSSPKTIAIPRVPGTASTPSGITLFKSDNSMMINGMDFRNYAGTDMKYYINGKEATKAEMDKVDPKDIKSVNVNSTNGKGDLKIETR
ncbi:M56 family metallopeptidase [Soonwooa sp.]|uniref:M56 family metallopeptidase n=1 Tax=Soonwooa sp. TaxID=1938592 RepID=UPI00260E8E22|nr:M56 family metallopeptidase [Soonwooa sp.]